MNLQKAKEILTNEVPELKNEYGFDFIDALKLGIEALKAIQDTRLPTSHSLPSWLPGETEE